jgi:hypothetical protein
MERVRASDVSIFAVCVTVLASCFAMANVASAASAPTPSGGIGVRLLANASNSSAEPLTLTYMVERLAPGSRVCRDIEISNTTDALADVAVFPAGASYIDNKFSFAPGRGGDSLSGWTTVAHSLIKLAPGARVLDAVTIAVPKRVSAGERYAVVWAEVSAPSPTESGVRLVNRVGVRMYVSVGRGGLPVADFTVGSLVPGRSANGDSLVAANVDNVGRAAIDITGTLMLSEGPGDLSAGPFPVTIGTMLAPNHSAIEQVVLSREIPRGPWRADLSLSSDGTQRSSTDAIMFPALALSPRKHSIAPLTLAVVLALLLLLAGGGSVVFSRRRRQRLE